MEMRINIKITFLFLKYVGNSLTNINKIYVEVNKTQVNGLYIFSFFLFFFLYFLVYYVGHVRGSFIFDLRLAIM